MNNMVKKWFPGIGKTLELKNKEARRQELLNDPIAIELFEIFYKEGSAYIWHPTACMTCEELLKSLKK